MYLHKRSLFTFRINFHRRGSRDRHLTHRHTLPSWTSLVRHHLLGRRYSSGCYHHVEQASCRKQLEGFGKDYNKKTLKLFCLKKCYLDLHKFRSVEERFMWYLINVLHSYRSIVMWQFQSGTWASGGGLGLPRRICL
jgi:hypothetical protein